MWTKNFAFEVIAFSQSLRVMMTIYAVEASIGVRATYWISLLSGILALRFAFTITD